ncbi:MAG TPA: ring-cleaving dioxygenase [Anaerolineales bacterium]|nr:ring-cleaving dioxygenase [Anaerolineales bacterium]
MEPIKGLHHVTAVARDPQRNIDFYRNVLGQRFVKRTVNFDSPDTYHFYFGDEAGSPGSILTFFAWPNMRRGIRGNGETNALAYNVPAGSLGFWQEHLKQNGITPKAIEKRFGEDVLAFDDPDSMRVELVETASAAPVRFWEAGPIPQSYALQGFHSVTLWLDEVEPTADLLTKNMGYRAAGNESDRYRFVGDSNVSGPIVDIVHRPGKTPAGFGAGSIHHIAFRVPTDEKQLDYQNAIRQAGFRVTEVMDRSYFHSIYFRELGGVLFEIATDTPGFALDEPVESLGESLKLPEWFEPNRVAIEQSLPPVTLKPFEKVAS